MSQPSRRRLCIETNGEAGRVRDDCVFQWVKDKYANSGARYCTLALVHNYK